MNTIKENSKDAFNQQAATYDKDIKGQHARSLYPVLLEKLSHIPFQSALDLGCGTGEMLKLILQSDTHKELCGIDLSEEMLAVAKSKLPEQVKILLGDSEALPFPDNAFDVAVSYTHLGYLYLSVQLRYWDSAGHSAGSRERMSKK